MQAEGLYANVGEAKRRCYENFVDELKYRITSTSETRSYVLAENMIIYSEAA